MSQEFPISLHQVAAKAAPLLHLTLEQAQDCCVPLERLYGAPAPDAGDPVKSALGYHVIAPAGASLLMDQEGNVLLAEAGDDPADHLDRFLRGERTV